MSKVRAKFMVTSKTKPPTTPEPIKDQPVYVTMLPVQGEPFGKYTPAGRIEMTIQNDAAADQLIIGKEYYVDFILAVEGE